MGGASGGGVLADQAREWHTVGPVLGSFGIEARRVVCHHGELERRLLRVAVAQPLSMRAVDGHASRGEALIIIHGVGIDLPENKQMNSNKLRVALFTVLA